MRAGADDDGDPIGVGGTGFALMTLIVAVERGWVTREAVLERLARMLAVLLRAVSYHGALPHFVNGASGATIPFTRKDDGGDLVETSFLCMGLLCARRYFDRDTPLERRLRAQMTQLWEEVEWSWYTQSQRPAALLALEPEQWLGHGLRDPRLERVPHHLRARGRLATLRDRSHRLSSRLCRRARIPQRPQLLRQ